MNAFPFIRTAILALASILLIGVLMMPCSGLLSVAIADSPVTAYLPLVMSDAGPVPTNPCGPGQTVTDPANDVSLAHIDVTALESLQTGETLSATLHLRDIPPTLTFNRIGVPLNYGEYEWGVYIDTDGDAQTGSTRWNAKGAEYGLTAFHSVVTPDSPVDLPIQDGVTVYVCRWDSGVTTFFCVPQGTITVDSQLDVITLTGTIPGIGGRSRLSFFTRDYNPGSTSQYDTSSCAQ